MQASRRGNNGGGGCAALLGFILVVGAIIWVFSSVGHFLGLTSTFDEVTNRPDGWVGRNYTGVFWGYFLTVLLITGGGVDPVSTPGASRAPRRTRPAMPARTRRFVLMPAQNRRGAWECRETNVRAFS